MANYSVLKAAVQAVIKTNGNQEITGANMQSTLISIINSLGTGYQFMGVATPSTSPGTPDYNVAYIGGAGTYANFGSSVVVPVGSICVFKYNGSWVKEQIALFAGIDDVPTAGSNNLVKSGGVYKLQLETTGVTIPQWINANIDDETGKFSTRSVRVTNYTPIVCTKKVHIICSGDVRGNSVQLYKTGYSPIDGGVKDTDWISYNLPSSASRTDFYVEANTTYPNVYITFLRASNSSAEITKEEVAANVAIIDGNSIATDVQSLSDEIGLLDDKTDTAAYGRKIYSASLSVSASQQAIALEAFDFGNIVGIRFASNTATATIQVGWRTDSATLYDNVTSDWTRRITTSPIYRVYIYAETCTIAGDVVVEVIYKDIARLWMPDNVPTKDSTNLITSGAVYNSAQKSTVKELYLLGLDNTQSYYYVAFYNTYNNYYYLAVYDNTDTLRARYDGAVGSGVVRVRYGGVNEVVHGWAVIDIKTTNTAQIHVSIDISECSNLHNSPVLALHLGENLYGFGLAGFLKRDGSIGGNTSFSISDYIPILKKNIQFFNVCGGNETAYCALAFYTLEKDYIGIYETGDGSVTDFTLSASDIPDNCAYIRVNIYAIQSPFISMIDNEKEILNATKTTSGGGGGGGGDVVSFNSLHGENDLSENAYLLLDTVHISKNIVYSARILGTIQNISIGNGYIEPMSAHPNGRGYSAMWVNITPTQVMFYQNFSTTETLAATYDHELTLGNETTVSIISHFTETGLSAKILLSDGKGNLFDHSLPSWGLGRPFAQNLGTSSLNVEMRFMPTDIYCPVWIFGDSYLGYTNNNRWLYYAVQNGFSHFLLNSRPGENAAEGWSDLNTLIDAGGRPKTLCWCLGMNGVGTEEMIDGQYVINSYQKHYIDNVKELCESYGIVPVFSTIPTVPSLQKTGLSNYVRNLGCRYIDFAEAVGANSSGVWKTGMLSSDEVHPTTLGAEALASRAFLDCPEIAEGMILLT